MLDHADLERPMLSARCQALNMVRRIGGCFSSGQGGFKQETNFSESCSFMRPLRAGQEPQALRLQIDDGCLVHGGIDENAMETVWIGGADRS